MRKILTLMVAAISLACWGADNTPATYPGLMINGISPDGKWVASSEGGLFTMSIINRETGKKYSYSPNRGGSYVSGNGSYISNTGIVLGTTEFDGDAAYWDNGTWRHLPLRPTDIYGCFANAVTPDGSRITGYIFRSSLSLDAEMMAVPIYWDRKADGSYADYVELPIPATDFTGRSPQYILASDISADGRVIAGQIRDYAGFNPQPIVFREDADGNWTYEALHTELFVPAGVTYPAWPGDAPEFDASVYLSAEELAAFNAAVDAWDRYDEGAPQPTEFMTADEKAQYQAALNGWNWDNDPFGPNVQNYMTADEYDAYIAAVDDFYAAMPEYPTCVDFMSPEELAQYNADRAVFDQEYAAWEEAYSAFMSAYLASAAVAPTFAQNNALLSADGRYYVTTDYLVDYMMGITDLTPYVFDLTTGEAHKYPGEQIYANYVNDDGVVLGARAVLQEAGLYCAYVSPGIGEPFVPLHDYYQANDGLLGWMRDNMRHDYVEYYFDPATQQVAERYIRDAWLTGMPTATPDLSVIVSWSGAWDNTCTEYYYSYVLPTDYTGAVKSLDSNALSVHLDRDGTLWVGAGAQHVTITDLGGRTVYESASPMSGMPTALPHGVYILRATAADGTQVVVKTAI